MFGLQGHVALLPMVRIGAYFAQDVSPASGAGTRTFWEGGLRAKVTPPLLAAPWRVYAFAGLGYAYAYEASHHGPSPSSGGAEPFVGGRWGGLLDLPAGLGVGARAWRGGLSSRGWVVFAELASRVGLGFYGPMYEHGALGKDSVALTLTVGISSEQ